ncbi:GNVR domain-containing protein, partial [Thermodesulfobacteriota bacterium]
LIKKTEELEYWERQVPSEKLTLSKITRERLASQTVYTELRKQLELAKISEAKELETFKVLDKPFVPERPFKPKKRIIVALTFVTSFFFALFGVFFLNFIRNLKKDEITVAES